MKLQQPMDRSLVLSEESHPFPRSAGSQATAAGSRPRFSFPSLRIAMFLCVISMLTSGVPLAAARTIAAAAPAEPPLAVASSMNVTLGKSALLRLPAAVARLSVGNPDIADVTLINPSQVYVLGKTIGMTNVILWTRGGQTAVINVTVLMDAAALQSTLQELMPEEKNIKVNPAGDSLVLSGTVSDTLKADRAVALADAYVRASAGAQGGPQRSGAQGGAQGGMQGGAQGG
ncbi:MAG: pilus assembly protein N-terminal domain-containing protein, partial [Betaproteobacteria bacterium]|nr:pilus assembly protein N-terminal domain-containing protein [Betaproteobacteria bacterium]